MIIRVTKHDHVDIQDSENCVIRFANGLVYINSRSEMIGGPIENHHQDLVTIFEKAKLFFLEDVPVKYAEGFMEFVTELFEKYENPDLGMAYFNLMGNSTKKSIYGKRFTPEYLMNNKPLFGVVNKKLCPGLPMVLDANLIGEIANKAPIVYYPDNRVTLV